MKYRLGACVFMLCMCATRRCYAMLCDVFKCRHPVCTCVYVYTYSTRAKLEVAIKERFNPIRQDTKNGQLRYERDGELQTYHDQRQSFQYVHVHVMYTGTYMYVCMHRSTSQMCCYACQFLYVWWYPIQLWLVSISTLLLHASRVDRLILLMLTRMYCYACTCCMYDPRFLCSLCSMLIPSTTCHICLSLSQSSPNLGKSASYRSCHQMSRW